MKIKILAIALSALALGFTACDDDDDDPIISTNPSQEIDGMSFDGTFQMVNTTSNDTTYAAGTLAFAATDSAYACTVTVTVPDKSIDVSSAANVVKTSHGFAFNNSLSTDISVTGFLGTISNDGEAMIYFEKPVKNGRWTVNTTFLFSNK